MTQAGGLALLTPPAACDLDIFHYITAYIHNMHAIEALIVNRAVWTWTTWTTMRYKFNIFF